MVHLNFQNLTFKHENKCNKLYKYLFCKNSKQVSKLPHMHLFNVFAKTLFFIIDNPGHPNGKCLGHHCQNLHKKVSNGAH